MNSNSIIIACRRLPDMTHARLTPSKAKLTVEYGKVSIGEFVMFEHETLTFDENPELFDVWNGVCWNVAELAEFVAHMDCYDCAAKVNV